MNYKILLLSLILLCNPVVSRADRVVTALKKLNKNKTAEARATLDKELAKKPRNAGAKYVYGLYFLSLNQPQIYLDSAYRYILEAKAEIPLIDKKTAKNWRKWGITDMAIDSKKKYIDSLAFALISEKNTITDYQYFIDCFSTAVQLDDAVLKRDELAFAEASAINTYESYRSFLDAYPNARQARDAEKLFDLLVFEFQTQDGDLTAFELFLELYPESPYKQEAERRIYELFTAKHTRQVYYDFVHRYPNNTFAAHAWNWIYSLYKQDSPVSGFLTAYPDFYDKAYAQKLIAAEPLSYFPVYEEEKYGFANANGQLQIPIQFDSVATDYFCEGVKANFLLVYNKKGVGAIDKTGRKIVGFGYESIEEMDESLLLVKKDGKFGVIHLTGFEVLPTRYDEIEPIQDAFLITRIGDKVGLTNFSGRKVTPVAYDEIEGVENDLMAFKRQGKYALINQDKLLSGKDTALDFKFTSYEWIKKGFLKVKIDSLHAIYSTQLNEVIPPTSHVINALPKGWTVEKDAKFQLFDLQGQLLTDSLFDDITGNGVFYAARKGNNWDIWNSNTSPRLKFDYDTVMLMGTEGFAVLKNKIMYAYFNPDIFLRLGNYTKASLQKSLKPSTQYWIVVEDKNGKKGLFSIKGGMLLPVKFDKLTVWETDLVHIQQNGRSGLMNIKGKTFLPLIYSGLEYQSNGYIATLKLGKFGLLNTDKDINIPAIYDKIPKLYDEAGNLFIVAKNGKLGLISSGNQPVADFEFDEIRYWQYGVALVKQDQTWQLYQIAEKKFIFRPIDEIQTIRSDKNEIILKVYSGKSYGILSNVKGMVVDFEYDDLRNVGTPEIPFYLAEKHIDNADVYLVYYIDRLGTMIRKQIFDQKRYERIVCD